MSRSVIRGIGSSLLTVAAKALSNREGQLLLPVLHGPAKGLKFRFDFQRRIEMAYFLGTYDRSIAERLSRICQPGWTVWDCGTYLGFYTCLFSRLVGPTGRVVAFEPDPRNLLRTKQNSALNNFNEVQFVNAAIGGPVGQIEFIMSDSSNSHIPGGYVGSSPADYQERDDGRIMVRCMSLDEAYTTNGLPTPQLIKIDIEGAEKDAIFHANSLIQEAQPLFVLELHNPQCDAAAWEFSRSIGYSLTSLDTSRIIERREDVSGTLLCWPSAAHVHEGLR